MEEREGAWIKQESLIPAATINKIVQATNGMDLSAGNQIMATNVMDNTNNNAGVNSRKRNSGVGRSVMLQVWRAGVGHR